MPIISWEQTLGLLEPSRGAVPEVDPAPVEEKLNAGFVDVAAAALRKQNLLTNTIDLIDRPSYKRLEGYNPFADPSELAGNERFADRVVGSNSPEETADILARAHREEVGSKILSQAGGWGIAAEVAAGLISPEMLASMAIPVAAPVAWGSRGARIGMGVAAQVGVDTGAEVLFHQAQETRTIAESALRIGAGAILTGALGGIATRVPKSEFDKLAKRLGKELNAPQEVGSTVGAASAKFQTTLEDEGIAKGGKFIASTLGRISPTTRVLQAPVKTARQLVQRMVEIPYWLEKNLRGVPTPDNIETAIKRGINQRRVTTATAFDKSFAEYSQRAGKQALPRNKFGEAVSEALQSGDESLIPEVQKFARDVRKLFEADKKALQELGVLPEDFTLLGAKSYFPRVYDAERIIADRINFEKAIYKWFAENPKPVVEEIEVAGEAAAKTEEQVAKHIYREPPEINAAVKETVDRILGTVRGMADVGHGGYVNPSPLKQRVLDVPDEVLRPWLVMDFDRTMQGYFRAMQPQLEMRKAFGSTTLKNEIDEIVDESRVLIDRAETNAAKEEIRKATANAINDLTGLRDRLLGHDGPRLNHNQWLVKAAKFVRSYNYVRALGAQTLSSLSDYGHLVSRFGLVKTGRMTAKFLTSLKANKIMREDAKRIGTAIDWTIDTRGKTFAEIGDELAGSKLERGMQWATQRFTRVSGMATWNSSVKAITAALEQDAILRAVGQKNLSAIRKAKLAQNGIGEAELNQIAAQYAKYGENMDGLLRARTDLWDDKAAAKLFEDAVVRTADIMVITRSVGDIPMMMNSEVGKTLMQFKSFGISATNRISIPMAQQLARGDLAAANGLMAMLSMGALTYYMKELAAGREPDLSPDRVISEALNWSGALAYLPDVYDPLAGLVHAPRLSRYSDTSPLAFALGPTFGTATDIMQTIPAITDLGMTQSDVHKVRKLLPLQNVFYLRRIINALEGEAGEAIDAEGSTNKSFADRVTETEEVNK